MPISVKTSCRLLLGDNRLNSDRSGPLLQMIEWKGAGGKRAGEKDALEDAASVDDILDRISDRRLVAQVTVLREQFDLYYDGDDAYDDLTFRSAGYELVDTCEKAGFS